MPQREDAIRNAIQNLDDHDFERFVTALLSRDLYSGLTPTSGTHDLGEDAHTEPTTLFLHDNKWISLAISKESGWGKLNKDCTRCKTTRREINILVFVTSGNPRTDTVERWKDDVQKQYGWTLVVHTIDFLAPFASRPEYESLVDDYLAIPPPDGDYIQNIQEIFSRYTQRYLNKIPTKIKGVDLPFTRNEVEKIENHLSQKKNVILTGEAGTGKSGIAALLTYGSLRAKKNILLVDARQLGNIKTEGELRSFFNLKGPLYAAIERIGKHMGLRIIFDQMDNITGTESANLIVTLIEECVQRSTGLEIIVICRNKEVHEKDLLERFINMGFKEVISYELNEERVKTFLKNVGILNYSGKLIELGKNLLNLELISQIYHKQTNFNFTTITDEVFLWEEYIQIWLIREDIIGEEMLSDASKIALICLNNPEGKFIASIPISKSIQRLESWGIIHLDDGRVFKFRHEKFQDFIYARDAVERQLKPDNILKEIPSYKTQNIFKWVLQILDHRNSPMKKRFFMEVFNVE